MGKNDISTGSKYFITGWNNFYFLWMIYFITPVFFFMILGFYYWPGQLTPDSFSELDQAMRFEPIANNIPVINILLHEFFLKIGKYFGGTFYYLAFQLLFVSIITSFCASILIKSFFDDTKLSFKIFFGSIIAFFLSIFPPNGILNITLLKDVITTWLFVLVLCCQMCFLFLLSLRIEKYSLFYISAVCSSISLFFRHNSFTLVYPLTVLFLLLYFYASKHSRKIKIVKHILVYMGILFSIIVIKNTMTDHYLNGRKSEFETFDLKAWIIRNDFLMGLKLNLPILSPDQRAELENFFDVKKTLPTLSEKNSFYQSITIYNRNGKDSSNSKEFIDFSKKILVSHPFYWIYIRLNYANEIIFSKNSYIVPLFDYDYFGMNGKYHVNLDMDKNMRPMRNTIRKVYGLDGGFPHSSILIWNFWPVIFIQMVSLLFLGNRFYFQRIKRKSDGYFRYKITLSIALIPIFSSIFLSFPLVICDSSNDFRYFWPNKLFTFILMIYLFSCFLNSKNLFFRRGCNEFNACQ